MPAFLTIPPGADVYHGQAGGNAYPVFDDYPFDRPKEGYKRVPVSINWAVDAPSGAMTFALAGRVSEFVGIRGMYIDNTQCGADLQVIFTDSQFEFTCAAGEKDFFQVSSSQLNFAIVANGALSGDKTFIQLFNYAPRPLGNYKSVYSSAGASSALAMTGNGTTGIVTVAGTITGWDLMVSGVTGGDATTMVTLKLTDSTGGHVFFNGFIAGAGGGIVIPFAIISQQAGLNLRCNGPITLQVVTSGTALTSGQYSGTVYYRSP